MSDFGEGAPVDDGAYSEDRAAYGQARLVPTRCPTCDSALADPKSGWCVAAPECSDQWHRAVLSDRSEPS